MLPQARLHNRNLFEEDDRGSDCLQDSGAGGIDIHTIDDGIDGVETFPFEVN